MRRLVPFQVSFEKKVHIDLLKCKSVPKSAVLTFPSKEINASFQWKGEKLVAWNYSFNLLQDPFFQQVSFTFCPVKSEKFTFCCKTLFIFGLVLRKQPFYRVKAKVLTFFYTSCSSAD